jgi:hypothetical protein
MLIDLSAASSAAARNIHLCRHCCPVPGCQAASPGSLNLYNHRRPDAQGPLCNGR